MKSILLIKNINHVAEYIFVIIIFALLHGILTPAYGQWTKHFIDANLDGAAGLAIADMNGDDILDVVASGYEVDDIVWYEAPLWTKHVITGNLDEAADLCVGNMLGNNTLDVIATRYTGGIFCYEAPSWIMHPIDNNSLGIQNVKVADINGDDTLDVVAAGYNENNVRWYQAPTFTKHIIDPNLVGARGLQIVDMNGDDTLDIVAAGRMANDVVWYEGPLWTKHVIDSELEGAIGINIADLDSDGILDVVAVGHEADDVVWYKGPSMIKHVIDSEMDGARKVAISDIDNDTDLDVVVTGMYADNVVWYEAPSWTKHIIDFDMDGAYFLYTVDIDGDDDIDVVADGHYADDVVWYENIMFEAYIASSNVFPKYIQPQGDTLLITALVSNIEDHPAVVYTLICNDEQTFQDSIELFDDGLHGDGDASDNLWGGKKWLSGLQEDMYTLEFYSNDLITGNTNLYPIKSHFTTAGPIVNESYSVIDISDNRIGLADFTLKNNGSVKTIEDVKAKLKTSDTCVTEITLNDTYFGDIASGESKTVPFGFAFSFSGCTLIEFELEIRSDGIVYWTESLTVDILTDLKAEIPDLPIDFALEQNYPNPFNPTTSISYSIPKQSHVNLKVFDVLGNEIAELVNEEKPIGNFKVEFDASDLTSGAYFYRLQAVDFVETKKMILIK